MDYTGLLSWLGMGASDPKQQLLKQWQESDAANGITSHAAPYKADTGGLLSSLASADTSGISQGMGLLGDQQKKQQAEQDYLAQAMQNAQAYAQAMQAQRQAVSQQMQQQPAQQAPQMGIMPTMTPQQIFAMRQKSMMGF